MADAEALVSYETRAFWVGAEARLGDCARCPEDGAACSETGDRVPPGYLVRLTVVGGAPREERKVCERYQGFSLARKLESAGVAGSMTRLTLTSLNRLAPPPNVVLAFDGFLQAGDDRAAPRRQNLLIEGKLAREYGVVLLRSVLLAHPNSGSRSVHVPTLMREQKNAMTVKEDSPMEALKDASVLVLDDVRTEILKNGWFLGELTWLYERRRDQGLSTIITSTGAVKEAFQDVRVLKV